MTETYPDFSALRKFYEEGLSPGQRAEIRRAITPGELALSSAFYRLLPAGVSASTQMRRVAFLLPHAGHIEGAGNIGQQLAKAVKPVSEMRLFQMVRTDDSDLALQRLRRLCQHVKATVDWNLFGLTLFYWGDRVKKQIVEDYYKSGGGK